MKLGADSLFVNLRANKGAKEASGSGKEAVMRRILVVDGDLHSRLAIRAWLKRYGFRAAPTVPLIAISGAAFAGPETDTPVYGSADEASGG